MDHLGQYLIYQEHKLEDKYSFRRDAFNRYKRLLLSRELKDLHRTSKSSCNNYAISQ